MLGLWLTACDPASPHLALNVPPEADGGAQLDVNAPQDAQADVAASNDLGAPEEARCADSPLGRSPLAAPAPPSSPPFLGLPPALELVAEAWKTVEAYPHLSFNNPVAFEQAPGLGWVFVGEREGRIYGFANEPNVAEKQLVLDLSGVNQGGGDSGVLGLAFHPEFAQSESEHYGFVFIHYAYSEAPVVDTAPPPATATHSRLSRFTFDWQAQSFDPASELVLIDQFDRDIWHQGGALFFHPEDGFLYLAVGDEGGANCVLENCQRIDHNLFSGVLRIDVDQRGGDVSHPIPRQPRDGTTAHYFIPNDNPFVGQAGALEEFYALGLRSPHRMTYDAHDNIVWMGDVGQSAREELNVLQRGANYQWHAFEGLRRTKAPLPKAPLGVWTNPVLELPRGEARSVIGGYVYRGKRFPELVGKYIFGDYVMGNVWALSYSYDGASVSQVENQRLLQMGRNPSNGLTSFGIDDQGEIYMLFIGHGSKIHRLERATAKSNAPRWLSETGVFSDTEAMRVATGLTAYDVQSPLWSDGSEKTRWISLPKGSTIGFSEREPWKFPLGTVFVKHFELALNECQPHVRRRLETRILVAGTQDYYGLTYVWNAEGTDAEVLTTARVETVEVVDQAGLARQQPHHYPSPGECMTCHNAAAGHVLGVRTPQINGTFAYRAPLEKNAMQLALWAQQGLLDEAVHAKPLASYPSFARLSDETRPVEERVRAYWDSNCSMCHGVVEGLRAAWDARFDTPLPIQNVVLGVPRNGGADGMYLVNPGDVTSSMLYQRLVTSDPALAMPPLGRSQPDRRYLQLLETWITSIANWPATGFAAP